METAKASKVKARIYAAIPNLGSTHVVDFARESTALSPPLKGVCDERAKNKTNEAVAGYAEMPRDADARRGNHPWAPVCPSFVGGYSLVRIELREKLQPRLGVMIHDQASHRRAHITGGSSSDEDLNQNTVNGPSLRRMSHVKQLPRDLKRDERLACARREREPDARPILRGARSTRSTAMSW